MRTRKLYYEDGYMRVFESKVLACEKAKNGWAVELAATAFFPEEGGQEADKGVLGGVRVLDAREKDGVILHTTDGPLPVGRVVTGQIDWPDRFRKMQTHTGEHIVSGIIHRKYGFDNVGFHLGDDGCTVDVSGELTREQLDQIEREANEVVWRDAAVTARFPLACELARMEYRSKLELTHDVRIVTVEGIDQCACCAPHVSSTGQIGCIKLLDLMRHRGGVRVWMKAGPDALADYQGRYADTVKISGLLNTPQGDIAAGAEKLLAQRDELKREIAGLRRQEAERLAAALEPTPGDILLFVQSDEDGMRALVNAGMEKAGGVCAVFSGKDRDWRFVMGSKQTDMRAFLREHGPELGAKGGGQAGMVSGRCQATKAELEAFFG